MTEEVQQQNASGVAYRLDSLANTVAGNIMVVGYGNHMRSTVRICNKAGVANLWVTGTEDKRRAFSSGGMAQVAILGKKFDKRLFTNEYAVIKAAEEAGAGALMMCDWDFADSTLLQMLAKKHGMMLLTRVMEDTTGNTWLVHSYPEDAPMWDVEWSACPKCKLNHDHITVMDAGGVCPTCGELYRLNSDERIDATFDPGSFEEWNTGIEQTDPLNFPDYPAKLEGMRKKSGLEEAVRCGKARLRGVEVAFCVMESTFMMGSMGSVVGEKITRTVERATAEGLPLIIFSASGGARMQEGLVSLMQMAKISAAVERHSRAGLLYISVLTDPTTGGVTASFAMQGDIIISEPHATIGFAGRRVIEDTIRQTLPDSFQTAEFALEHGLIDAIVPRHEVPNFLAQALAIHLASSDRKNDDAVQAVIEAVRTMDPTMLQAEVPADETPVSNVLKAVQDLINTGGKRLLGRKDDLVNVANITKSWERNRNGNLDRALQRRGVADAPGVAPMTDEEAGGNPAWESVMLARNVHRPTAQYYINNVFDGFIELHGDRAFADDGAIMGGIAWFEGQPVTVIAEEKGADLKQRVARNFGCPEPEGYRKSFRLMKQAEKFHRPIVCLVDTQGAFCGADAEERGQGNAIADNLKMMAGLKVPVVSIVLGEGGSGGALALAVGNRVGMQKHAVYSVLSPEGFASILWKDRSRAAEAAAAMKMSADEACEMGLIEEVVSEGDSSADQNPEQAAANVADFVRRSLAELTPLTPEELLDQRYLRFRAF